MKDINEFFQNNPKIGALIPILLGIILIIGAKRDWKWIYEQDGKVFNLSWFKYNMGDKVARIIIYILSVLLILSGLILFVLI